MAWPSDSTRSKNWGTEILTDADLEAQLDLLHQYFIDALNGTTGHAHTGGSNQGPKLSLTAAVSGTLPIANGGTNITTYTQGDILYSSASNVLSKLAAGTAGYVLKTGGAAANPSWVNPILSYVKCSNTQTSGTNGGTATSGAWRTATLNTEDIDADGICTLGSNQVTLSAGTYRVHAFQVFTQTDLSQIRIQNVTDTSTVLIGNTVTSANGTSYGITSLICGQFTVAASKALELQYQVQTTVANTGLGRPGSFGSEVYAQIEFIKIS
jgi:hypothetical protein